MGSRSRQRLSVDVFLPFFLLASLQNKLSIAADSISPGEILTGSKTITSNGGNFELGFFRPGNSQYYYIGIWYKNVLEKTCVWVANRETPLPDPSSQLRISEDGNLILTNQSKAVIWSTNSTSRTPNSTVAVLLDDGNLVLRGRSNSWTAIWQSFDHPTDTWLPGARLGLNKVTGERQRLTSWRNSGDPAPGDFALDIAPDETNEFLLTWSRSERYWSSGQWNGRIFSAVPEMARNYFYNFSYTDNTREKYFSYSVYNLSNISRFVLGVSGQIQQWSWLELQGKWLLFWSQPMDPCDVYSLCGSFGICNSENQAFCGCLQDFEPKSPTDWSLGGWSGGCERKIPLSCGNGGKYIFSSMPTWQMPPDHVSVEAAGAEDCRSLCSSRCSCNAYAHESNSCLIWEGDLLNVKNLSVGYIDGGKLYIRVAAVGDGGGRKGHTLLLILTLTITLGTVVAGAFGYFMWRRVKNGGNLPHVRENTPNVQEFLQSSKFLEEAEVSLDTDIPFFKLESIAAATDNFSDSNKLGKGGFGPVYKGILPEGGFIAVKRLSRSSGQGMEEFKNEVMLIAKLQHRNLVRLLGYCIEGDEKMLVYEYMSNKSLDTFLFDQNRRKFLDWKRRFIIILGISRGLLYLHEDSRLRIIHRDLKTSNILLDEQMKAKISDFGLARIFGENQNLANTNRVVGTYGYMSPEYASHGLFSQKSDVFSFGVILLEIISGKKNTSFYQSEHSYTLLGHAWRLWEQDKILDLIDASIQEECNKHEVLKCVQVGLLCVQEDPINRPTMASVVGMLVSEITTLPTPKKPAFIIRSISRITSSPSVQDADSRQEITVSTLSGR